MEVRGKEQFDVDVLEHRLDIYAEDVVLNQRAVDCQQAISRNPPVAEAIIGLGSEFKPLWEYDTPTTFIRALLAIVEGLDTLDKHGVKPRDINPGNLLLSVGPRPGHEASLVDLDFADHPGRRMDAKLRRETQKNLVTVVSGPEEPSPHIEMAGTVQFMPVKRLRYLLELSGVDRGQPRPAPYENGVDEALEAVFWVAVYALYRKAYDEHGSANKDVFAHFQREFGMVDIPTTLRTRQYFVRSTVNAAHETTLWKMIPYFDKEVQDLIPALGVLVNSQMLSNNEPIPVPSHMYAYSDVVIARSLQRQRQFAEAEPMTCAAVKELLISYTKARLPASALDGLA